MQHIAKAPDRSASQSGVYVGEFTKVMTWLPDSPDLIFAAGNIITIMNSKSDMLLLQHDAIAIRCNQKHSRMYCNRYKFSLLWLHTKA